MTRYTRQWRITLPLLIVAVLLTAFVALGVVPWLWPVRAKTVPEPGECAAWATVGVQVVTRCTDPSSGITCFLNNYGFLTCLQP